MQNEGSWPQRLPLGVIFELDCEDCFGWERKEQLMQEAETQKELDVGKQ